MLDERTTLETAVVDAQAALDADIAADGDTATLEQDLANAQAAVDQANANADLTALQQDIDDAQATLDVRVDLENAVTLAESEFDAAAAASNPLYSDLQTAQGQLETAQDNLEDRNELISDVSDAQALVDTLEELNAGIDGAEDAITDLGFELPVSAEGSVFGTAGDDIFLFASEDATIGSFGATGEDQLYIGEEFAFNADLEAGDNAALEVFFTQEGNNAVVSIEQSEFGSNAATPEVNEITLTGVNVDELSFSNGTVTIVEAA